MMRRSEQRRPGFTLIELLVVISIIAILIGLTLAAVMQALGVGPRADTTSRISAVSNAIGTFKSERSVTYIPGGQIDDNPTLANGKANPAFGSVVGPFRLRNIYPPPGSPLLAQNGGGPDNTSFEARYIKRVFPNADIDGSLTPAGSATVAGLGNPNGSNPININFNGDLDANQTLLFFLDGLTDNDGQGNFAFRGFSKNPLKPFEPSSVTTSDRTKPYLDITTKHYLAPVNTKFNAAGNPNPQPTPNPNYPWLVDGWKRPFAYFAAYNGKEVKVPTANTPPSPTAYDGFNTLFVTPNVKDVSVSMGTPKAYINGVRYELPSGFQIISAGKDGLFGQSGDWNNVDKTGQDDRVNFSTNNLGAGPK